MVHTRRQGLMIRGLLATLVAVSLLAGQLGAAAARPEPGFTEPLAATNIDDVADADSTIEDEETEGFVVSGEAVSFADGVLTVQLPPAVTEELDDGSVVQVRPVIEGLGEVSDETLEATLSDDVIVELVVGDIALLEPGTPLLLAGEVVEHGIEVELVLDLSGPLEFEPEPFVGEAPLVDLEASSEAVPDWVFELIDDEPMPMTLPPCVEGSLLNDGSCVATFPGARGSSYEKKADFDYIVLPSGGFNVHLTGFRVKYQLGEEWEFPFEFDVTAEPGLQIGQLGEAQVSMTPQGTSGSTYSIGAYAGVRLMFAYCTPPIPYAGKFCPIKNKTWAFEIGVLSETTDPAPMHGQTVELANDACSTIDITIFLQKLPLPVTLWDFFGVRHCLDARVQGANLEAKVGGDQPLSHPGGPVEVLPTEAQTLLNLGSFSYQPTIDLAVRLDLYVGDEENPLDLHRAWELHRWASASYQLGAIPTDGELCPGGRIPGGEWWQVYSCGTQPQMLSFELAATGQIPPPSDSAYFYVLPEREHLGGSGWDPGATVTVLIEPESGGMTALTGTTNQWGDFGLSVPGVGAGDRLTVSDGRTSKVHTVEQLTTTAEFRTGPQIHVRGTATPERSVLVAILEQPSSTHVFTQATAGADGLWSARFEDVEVTAHDFWAMVYDDDGDYTWVTDTLDTPLPSCAWVSPLRFPDVPTGNVHRDRIGCAAALGLVTGFTDGTFGPERNITRAQLASILARALRESGVRLPDGNAVFTDVTGGPHASNIHALAAIGVIKGKTATTFEPNAPVQRAQLMSMLVRAGDHYAPAFPPAPSTLPFSDIAGNTHEQSIARAQVVGIAQGRADGTFNPWGTTRRDQAASFVTRWLDWRAESPR